MINVIQSNIEYTRTISRSTFPPIVPSAPYSPHPILYTHHTLRIHPPHPTLRKPSPLPSPIPVGRVCEGLGVKGGAEAVESGSHPSVQGLMSIRPSLYIDVFWITNRINYRCDQLSVYHSCVYGMDYIVHYTANIVRPTIYTIQCIISV